MRITRIMMVLVAGVLMLASSGCTTMKDSFRPREDITDLTKKSAYQETAKTFLNDDALAVKVPIDSQGYCRGLSGETGQKFNEKVFKVANMIDKFGGNGFAAGYKKDGLVSKPKMDFSQKFQFCKNFLDFQSGLTPDEERKLLIFLGKDYFSANWMQTKFASHDYRKQMTLSVEDKSAIQDVGFAPPPASNELNGYLQQRVGWQTRNSGIAMLGLFGNLGIDKELGPVNPGSLEELKRRYDLYRTTGFAWFTSDPQELMLGAAKTLKVFKTFSNRTQEHKRQVVGVWGNIELISYEDTYDCLKTLFERFPMGSEVGNFYHELELKEPDMTKVKAIAVDSVPDEMLLEAKRYARWLADGKPKERAVAADK